MACSGEAHESSSWDEAQQGMREHVLNVAHDARWPVTFRVRHSSGAGDVTYLPVGKVRD